MSKGLLITFEGSEAVGKSSLIKGIADFLRNHKHNILQTREPGGTEIAERIRRLIFDDSITPSSKTELLMMFAARRDHIEKIIIPALDAGKIILCDRYIDSSYIYQGLLGGVDLETIDHLVNDFVSPYLPDLCFLIDVPTEVTLERLDKRGAVNRNDRQNKEYYEKLRNAFLQHGQNQKNYPIKIIENINFQMSIDAICHEIQTKISKIRD